MTTTTTHGLPKPEITDPLADGWAAIGALADATDALITTLIPKAPLIYAATATVNLADLGGARWIRVRVRGNGGAGGGAAASAAGTAAIGAGGGQGAYAESWLEVSTLTFPLTATVPAAAVGATNAAGGAGGAVSFGSYVVAAGGAGGAAGAAAAPSMLAGYTSVGGVGGSAGSSTGQICIDGCPGDPGFAGGLPGRGGGNNLLLNFNSTPAAASGEGRGGQGAGTLAQATARPGGNAAKGYVIVELF